MKGEKEYQKWIERMYDKYKSVLFIEKYSLKSEKKQEGYLASRFNYPYLDIVIEYSEESINDWKKDSKSAERRIVHEFCHVITDPFYCVSVGYSTKEQIENERERMVDHIAQIINKHFQVK